MPLPTHKDIITGYHIIQRILLRKNFEELKCRQGSKYFKNIVIRDIPWGTITPIPINFPKEFKEKYPYDFDVQFTILGCNMLKCYKHEYNKKPKYNNKPNPGHHKPQQQYPQLINGYIFAGSEACYKVYSEFDSFLRERFKIDKKYKKAQGTTDELWFETTSIEQRQYATNQQQSSSSNTSNKSVSHQCFCGMQLTDLKRYAILPSSRWHDTEASEIEDAVKVEQDENSSASKFLTAQKYFEIYLNEPMKLCDIAGLVDAPPLTWNEKIQNVSFNEEYCRRFRKFYDLAGDACLKYTHRKVLGHLLGENVINQFSDADFLFSFPVDFLIKSSTTAHGILEFPFNLGYEEKTISQKKLEKAVFVDVPDRVINNLEETVKIIRPNNEGLPYTLGYYKNSIAEDISHDMGRAILNILRAMTEETAIEESISSSPILIAFLLKTYSQKFLNRAIMITTTRAHLIPASVRISMIFLRTIITQVWLQMATKVLTLISTSASVVTSLGIFTLIPEILLTHYNIGGYNREITREQLAWQREECMNNTLKQMLKIEEEEKTHHKKLLLLSPLSYISIAAASSSTSKLSSSFISPLVTPEFLYNLCLINFHKHNPDCIVDIGFVGLDPDEEMSLLEEYISLLKVNSAGQYIFLREDEENPSSSSTNSLEEILLNKDDPSPYNKNFVVSPPSPPPITPPPTLTTKSSNNILEAELVLNNMPKRIHEKINAVSFDPKSTDTIFKMVGLNKDVYFLIMGLAMVIFVCSILFLFFCNYCTFYYVKFFWYKIFISFFIIFLYIGTYTIWFTVFKPSIIKSRNNHNNKKEE